MKKRILFSVVLCALVAAVFIVPYSVLAGEIRKFSGDAAYAAFLNTADPCAQTYGSVNVSRSKVHNPPGRPGADAEASVFLSVWNSCTNTEVFGSGTIPVGKKEFQIDNKLSSATLNTTIKVDKYQQICDQNSYPVCQRQFIGQVDVAVNLTWTATGALSTSTYTQSYESKFCKYTYTFTGSHRPAQAVGNVSAGTISFTQTNEAQLASSADGQREIGCN